MLSYTLRISYINSYNEEEAVNILFMCVEMCSFTLRAGLCVHSDIRPQATNKMFKLRNDFDPWRPSLLLEVHSANVPQTITLTLLVLSIKIFSKYNTCPVFYPLCMTCSGATPNAGASWSRIIK